MLAAFFLYIFYLIIMIFFDHILFPKNNLIYIKMGIGDGGIGDWGLGLGPNPQSPIPNPQSPIPIKTFLIQIK
jgi:hypothetical protein